MKRVILVGLALLFAGAASAQELKSPRISVAKVDWDAAAASIVDRPAGTPAEAFAKLNAAAGISFPRIDDSSVPVLLPYDADCFHQGSRGQSRASAGKGRRECRSFHAVGISADKIFRDWPSRL